MKARHRLNKVWSYRLASIFVLLLSSSLSIAGTCFSKIKAVYPNGSGNFSIKVYTLTPGDTTQCPTESYWAEVGVANVTVEGIDHLYSAALAAAASGKNVHIVHQPRSGGDNSIIRIQANF